ncbi:MAG: hypothetical protein FWD70_02090 [Desulfuromonadales bacterium]|nr:hypothetical protein [Desulfuromonadales bacterium]
MWDKIKTIGINVLIMLVIGLFLFWGETYLRQVWQYNNGEKALAAGNYTMAIAGYESSIHMYTPFSSYVEKSANRLWVIGELFEKQGQPERAIIAYRALRSSFYSTHGLVNPGMDWIKRCDEKIEPLVKLIALQNR